MSSTVDLVVFTLDGFKYALRLSSTERAFRAVEVTPLPEGPELAVGIINLRGKVVPVLDIRRRFGLSPKEIELTDHLLVARTSNRTVALLVDAVIGVIQNEDLPVLQPDKILPGIQHIEGVVRLEEGLVLIHDLNTFLSLEEDRALDEALIASRR